MLEDESETVPIVRVPDSEKLPSADLAREKQDLVTATVAKHKPDSIDVTFNESSEREASRANGAQDVA